ncbi:leucyl/phenylalanyl-tRNA--protein transferase [Pontivivens ytuae]|uniref:Leucyl/phenylalanyl-tRNA--protein transferase n=1 Tax=Pontivivens ytuae TaxID=2789856 RepID=A0A7S9LQH8_9RHOB|nr:leucyl/phenylalanyl-tRNA--protein transferase [Pontivivens ytuae]QPH53261.1 leucyl/phenylalanyl-tRNA--protein transferase [Pontivivens ytuae]
MPRDAPEITPELLLNAYAAGVFPMAEHRTGPTQWVDPQRRGIIPLDGLHISRSLAKRIRRGGFSVTFDTAFGTVVRACSDREETWINDEIFALYSQLHTMGFAHSIEIRQGSLLVGGLYGVRLGAAFFGESMFSRASDASKVALVWLLARLNAGGFRLLDTQFVTSHLTRMGAIEVSRAAYHRRLAQALTVRADWNALPADAAPEDVLRLARTALP